MNRFVMVGCISTALLVGHIEQGWAQPLAKLTPAQVNELERKGFEAYGSANWGEALIKWSEALLHEPERSYLLYFKAMALFRRGDLETSRRYALEARQAKPALDDDYAQKNEKLIAELARIEAEEADKKRVELEQRQTNKQIADAVRPRASGWIWVGTGVLALGGASLGGAVWQSNQLVDVREKMKVRQTRPEYDALADEASGHRTLGQVFFLSSLALIGTGVGIIIWDLMTPEDVEPGQGVAPAAGVGLTPNGAFVRITW